MIDGASPVRVRFADRQFLQAADLQAEQRYHREMRWRHNRALHSWGVVAGLTVSVRAVKNGRGEVTVLPGMALDGYGRELVVPYPLTADRPLGPDTAYDIWLIYAESRSDGPASQMIQEQPRVVVTPRTDRQNPDPNQPDAVPVGDLEFGPDRPAPPDPVASPWPVFLAGAEFVDNTWAPSYAERRYAGLVADRIESQPVGENSAAETRTVILNGSDRQWSSYRFAVVADADADPTPETTPPCLAIRELAAPEKADAGGPRYQVELRADRVAVAGDLTLRNGSALEFAPNPVGPDDDRAGPLTGSEFWRVFHHFRPPRNANDTDYSDELRVTMPGGSGGVNRVSFGCATADGKFTPVLTVKDDKSVEVYGKLVVNGTITGRVTEAPAWVTGDAPDGLSPGQVRAAIRTFLTQPGTDRFKDVLDAIAADPAAARNPVSQYLVANPAILNIDQLAESWWQDTPDKAAESLGTSSSKATADTFRAFLGKLTTVSVADAPEPAVTEVARWVLPPPAPPGGPAVPPSNHAADLATGFPAAKSDQLVKFAKTLLETDGGSRVQALIDALIDANGAKVVIARLVEKARDAEMVNQLFTTAGHQADNFARAAGQLTATPADVRAFLGGLKEAPLNMLAAELFDGQWSAGPPTDAGKVAVVVALQDGLPPEVDATLTKPNTKNTRARAFLKFIRDRAAATGAEAAPFARVKKAIEFLVSKMSTASFWTD
jgi:hypothetical protein